MPLTPGDPAPWFTAPTASSPEFIFDTAAGRYVLLLFLPSGGEAQGLALRELAARQRLFDDVRASAFVFVPDPDLARGLRDMRGLRWVLDFEDELKGRFEAEASPWLLLDPTLRLLAAWPLEQGADALKAVASLPAPEAHAGVPLHAPVLVAPRIFEPDLCRALVGLHEGQGGGAFTGVMRDAGDRTVAVMDELKRRRDVLVEDPGLKAAVRERLERRLFPLIQRAFGSGVAHIERYVVSCYDAEDGGVFHPHRDNTTHGTAHRKFACSLNLNGGFEGGDLRFPEFGSATYRPPVGGAVVFACGLMHEATRVRAGRRYAFLPFFYDEAGASLLAAYRARTAQPAP